jgi:glycosyltransferase involved in cell wall biosynthesis
MTVSLRNKDNPFISILTPVLNEARLIETLVRTLTECLLALTSRFEILVIDDGSEDGTAEEVRRLESESQGRLKLIKFSRNFGKENALTAGLKYASGDAVILIDSDLQHPLEMIPAFLEKWREGYDNVYGVRIRTPKDQGWLGRCFAETFYRCNRYLMEMDLPANAGDFRLLDRKVVDAINQLPERSRFMKGLYAWVGFKSLGLPYKILPRGSGKSRFNFFRLFALAMTGVTAFSNVPLRIWSAVGALVSGCSFVYGLFLGVRTLIYGNEVSGWTTLAVGMFFLGGIQLLSIGVVAEYIGRIFNEVKHRPHYVIEEKIGFHPDSGQYTPRLSRD